MTKQQQNAYQGKSYFVGIKFTIPALSAISRHWYVVFCHGSSGIDWRRNCSGINGYFYGELTKYETIIRTSRFMIKVNNLFDINTFHLGKGTNSKWRPS